MDEVKRGWMKADVVRWRCFNIDEDIDEGKLI